MIKRIALFLGIFTAVAGGQAHAQAADSATAASDPVLRAMLTEMDRSKTKLKLENMQAPYYIDYRVTDFDQYAVAATFGALRSEGHQHMRMLRVTVRIGDYKQDSYYGAGEGTFDSAPLDDSVIALRYNLWLSTDRAYKAAAEALTAKQAELKQLKIDQPVDDFARAPAVQSVQPLLRLEVTPDPWLHILEEASSLYRKAPQTESLDAYLRFVVINRYFVSSEGTVLRGGKSFYQVSAAATSQAADGMRLDRSHSDEATDLKGLPSREQVIEQTNGLLASLKELREAPVVEEEYRGPILFSADAGATVMSELVAPNVLARKPKLGQNGRTTGAWANSYKARVLPDFMSVEDGPSLHEFGGHVLLGAYDYDDEGVKATRVSLVEKGQLVDFLVGRAPVRDIPQSNGHGRAVTGGPPLPNVGNLIVQSSAPLTNQELESKLLEMCKARDLPYCYYVETLGPRLSPRLLYRVWTKDGHRELVRGAVFGELDTRSLRNGIVAAGKDTFVENRLDPVPQSIVGPALLFDELEVKRADTSKEKLPDYPPPPISTSK